MLPKESTTDNTAINKIQECIIKRGRGWGGVGFIRGWKEELSMLDHVQRHIKSGATRTTDTEYRSKR